MSESGTLAFMVRALRHRNYRLFFMGQTVSLVGTWMTEVATSWLVFRLTGSALMLGVVGFSGQIPAFLFASIAGTFIDRWDKHRVLVVTQSLMMCQSFTLAALALTGHITIGWLIALNAFEGMVNAFDMPCRQAFVVTMVTDKADLANAIALNSSTVNLARLVGPSVGAVLIAAAGEGWCFLCDGISFAAVIAALLAMRVPAEEALKKAPRATGEAFREGLRYVLGFPPIRRIIALLAMVCVVGGPYMVLVPIFAGRIFHGGPHALGLLMTASGCGALLGAAFLASRRSVVGLVRLIPMATTTFGVGLILFSFARSLWAGLPMLLLVGFGFMVQLASSNTVIQTIVDDDKRGRVMSFYMMAFLGAMPFGSLSAGWLADHIGAPMTLRLGGTMCLLAAAAFAAGYAEMRRLIRPIYERMGILPALTEGIGSASQLGVPPEER